MTGLLFLFWYFIGGILPALYIGQSRGINIRETGSGNPGARNAGRILGKPVFVAVLLLDMLKGALPVWVSRSTGMSPTEQLLLLGAVMLGHCYPVAHRFRGGKGAAALLGGLIIFEPRIVLAIVLLAVCLYPIIHQKTKVAVLSMAAIVPATFVWYGGLASCAAFCLFALLAVTHRSYLIESKRKGRLI